MDVSLNTAGLDSLAANLQRQLGAVVRKTAFDVQAAAQQAVPRDTGAAANSIYTVTDGADGYAAAATEAASAGAAMLDQVRPGDIVSGVRGPSAIVAVGVKYGVYLEFGTTRMPARPFLSPAVALAEEGFLAACGQAVGLAASGGTTIASRLGTGEAVNGE